MEELISAAVQSGYRVVLHPKDSDGDYYVEIVNPAEENPYNHGSYDQYIEEAVSGAVANLIRHTPVKAGS